MKINVKIFVMIVMAIAITASIPYAQTKQKNGVMDVIFLPTGEMTLAVPSHIPAKRSAVSFSHSGHFIYTCTTCHHEWDLESRVSGCSTSGCHDSPKPKADPNKKADPAVKGRPYYQDAFHNTCRGCHRKMIEENKAGEKAGTPKKDLPKTGPAGCNSCHPRGERPKAVAGE